MLSGMFESNRLPKGDFLPGTIMSIWLGSRCVGISFEDSAQYNTRHSDARSACVRAAPVNTILLSRRGD